MKGIDMNYDIKKFDKTTSHFLPHVHQPFDVIGRFVPIFDGEKWSYKEVVCAENKKKTYEDLSIDSQYRRVGIGKKLMDSAVAWCKEQKFSGIALETQDNNLQACRFYTKYGFELCGINTQKYALTEYKDETALYFYLKI